MVGSRPPGWLCTPGSPECFALHFSAWNFWNINVRIGTFFWQQLEETMKPSRTKLNCAVFFSKDVFKKKSGFHWNQRSEIWTASLDTHPERFISLQCVEPPHFDGKNNKDVKQSHEQNKPLKLPQKIAPVTGILLSFRIF